VVVGEVQKSHPLRQILAGRVAVEHGMDIYKTERLARLVHRYKVMLAGMRSQAPRQILLVAVVVVHRVWAQILLLE